MGAIDTLARHPLAAAIGTISGEARDAYLAADSLRSPEKDQAHAALVHAERRSKV
jgi:hypothetical protein